MSGQFSSQAEAASRRLAMRTSVSTAARMMAAKMRDVSRNKRCEENRRRKCNAEEDQVQKSGQMSGRPKPSNNSSQRALLELHQRWLKFSMARIEN
jgi:hypothetical protein